MDSSGPKGQTKALKALQGRADLRAAAQPDPSEASGQPQIIMLLTLAKKSRANTDKRAALL